MNLTLLPSCKRPTDTLLVETLTHHRSDLQEAYENVLPAGSNSLESLLSLAAFALTAAWPPVSPRSSPQHALSDIPSVTGSDDEGTFGELLTEGSDSAEGKCMLPTPDRFPQVWLCVYDYSSPVDV
jgi:hypothetical protein